jgi:hypothetical protein
MKDMDFELRPARVLVKGARFATVYWAINTDKLWLVPYAASGATLVMN